MPLSHSYLEEILRNRFPQAEFALIDLVGDEDHYELQITTPEFSGLSKVSQHRLVYDALREYIGGDLHAISLKTHI